MKLAQHEAAIAAYKDATGQPVKSMALGSLLVQQFLQELKEEFIICEPQAGEGVLFGIPMLVVEGVLFGIPMLVVEEDPYLLALSSVEPGTL